MKVPNPTWIARNLNIHYSVYKLNACAMIVRKKYLFDALHLIDQATKKGGPLIKKCLESARVNGIKKGYHEERFFVKEVVLGKKLGPKMLDIKARGHTGIRNHPFSRLTVILEEKSAADFYKMMITGNCPASIGYIFRKILYQNEADFEHV